MRPSSLCLQPAYQYEVGLGHAGLCTWPTDARCNWVDLFRSVSVLFTCLLWTVTYEVNETKLTRPRPRSRPQFWPQTENEIFGLQIYAETEVLALKALPKFLSRDRSSLQTLSTVAVNEACRSSRSISRPSPCHSCSSHRKLTHIASDSWSRGLLIRRRLHNDRSISIDPSLVTNTPHHPTRRQLTTMTRSLPHVPISTSLKFLEIVSGIEMWQNCGVQKPCFFVISIHSCILCLRRPSRRSPKALCFRPVRSSVRACLCTCEPGEASTDRFAVDF